MANMAQICSRESCLLEDKNGWLAGLVCIIALNSLLVDGGEKDALSQRSKKKVMSTDELK